MADKKSANYYGGYSLYRSNAGGVQNSVPPPPSALHQAKQMASVFNPDWLSASMMMLGAAALPVPPPLAMPLPTLPRELPLMPSAMAAALPFLNNVLGAPSPYRGAPLRQQPTSAHAPAPHATAAPQPLSVTSNAAQAAPRAAPAQPEVRRAPRPAVPHFSDSWNAFDAVAPSQGTVRHEDPIGTPAARSVWAGTPAADERNKPAAPPGCSSSGSSMAFKPFNVWSSPIHALSSMVFPKPSPTTTLNTVEGFATAGGPTPPAQSKDFSAVEVDSDDEDWVEHLQSTLKLVLDDESSLSPQSKPHVEMEWMLRGVGASNAAA